MVEGLRLMGERQDVFRDTHGNLSYILDSRNLFWIKPSGMAYLDISETDVCSVLVAPDSADGKAVSLSQRKPSVDTPHHRVIYQKCPWVGAICHTHSPYASAFAIANRTMYVHSTEHADYFGRPVRCLPYKDLNVWGDNVADELRDNEKAIFLGSHGTLTFAETPMKAVQLALALENIAMKTILSWQVGPRSAGDLPQEEVEKWHIRYNGGGYGQ